jgi:hypothetical protein
VCVIATLPRETLKENEVILILHTHMTNEISETFKENEVMLLLHTHRTKEIRETFKENEVMLLLHTHMTNLIFFECFSNLFSPVCV